MTLHPRFYAPAQSAKNPWKRGGRYLRGRLAPWINNPENLSKEQTKRAQALATTMVEECTGEKGVTGGVVNAARCLRKHIPGKLSPEEKKEKYEERLEEQRVGKKSPFYSEEIAEKLKG